METHPGEGVVKEEKFPNSRNPSHWQVSGSLGISEGNITRRVEKKNTENMHLSTTTNREVPQMLTSTTCEWELDRKSLTECLG